MSFSDRIKNSFQESLLIGGVAGVGALIGADTSITSLLASSGVLRAVPGNLQQPLTMFAIVFVADLVYNVLLA
jgi:hypothetical protein